MDLHPDRVSNSQMGSIFEELIRKFAESSNETAGEHFTPREVIHLMVDLLFTPDDVDLHQPNIVRSVYDPTAGTGGMLSVAEERVRDGNPDATLMLAGQENNPESYAICKADMVIKGQDYARYDYVTADQLHESMRRVVEEYGSVSHMVKDAESMDDLRKRLLGFKGLGDLTADIFLNELPKEFNGRK